MRWFSAVKKVMAGEEGGKKMALEGVLLCGYFASSEIRDNLQRGEKVYRIYVSTGRDTFAVNVSQIPELASGVLNSKFTRNHYFVFQVVPTVFNGRLYFINPVLLKCEDSMQAPDDDIPEDGGELPFD